MDEKVCREIKYSIWTPEFRRVHHYSWIKKYLAVAHGCGVPILEALFSTAPPILCQYYIAQRLDECEWLMLTDVDNEKWGGGFVFRGISPTKWDFVFHVVADLHLHVGYHIIYCSKSVKLMERTICEKRNKAYSHVNAALSVYEARVEEDLPRKIKLLRTRRSFNGRKVEYLIVVLSAIIIYVLYYLSVSYFLNFLVGTFFKL